MRLVHWAKSSIALCIVITMSGCSTWNKAFYNREFEYLHTDVKQMPMIKTPKGMADPDLSPDYILPPGPTNYQARTDEIDIKPPELGQTYSSEQMAQLKQQNQQAKAKAEALKQQLAEVEQKLDQAQASQTIAAAATTTAAMTTSAAVSQPAVEKPVSKALKNTAVKLKPVYSKLTHDAEGVPMLMLRASMSRSWEAVGQALKHSAFYTITDSDYKHGWYFIAPKSQTKDHNGLLYLHAAGHNRTELQVYNDKGELSHSDNAKNLLKYLHKILRP